MSLFTRKPWRSGHGPFERYARWVHRHRLAYLAVQVANLVGWLRFAHDCQDPRIGCSCSGSYRFPAR